MKKQKLTEKVPIKSVPSSTRKKPDYKITILLVFFIFNLVQTKVFADYQQTDPITIKGTVKDPDGVPLLGASVMEKNTNNGTITDFNENHSITVSSQNSILVFSYVELKSMELKVGTQTTIDIQLETDSLSLDEVILVGTDLYNKNLITQFKQI